MSEHSASTEEWATRIRGLIESAEADGYDVFSDSEVEFGSPVEGRLTISPSDDPSTSAVVWIWGAKPWHAR